MSGNNRKRKYISLSVKIAILDRLKSGESIRSITEDLGFNESTIRTIRKDEEKIRNYVSWTSPQVLSKCSATKNLIYSKMETLLNLWMEDCNQKRIPLSTSILQAKSIKIFEYLRNESGTNEIFKASNGWFNRFRTRFNLHNLKISGEKASADNVAAENFKPILADIISKEGYRPEQVFNADESALFWKKMPDRTFTSQIDRTVPGYKASKDRITIMMCSNAKGTCIFKPLLINKFLNPRALKNIDKKTLPVYWDANSKGWMTAVLFRKWFNDCFVPDVERYLERTNLSFKALLLVDNASGHPSDLNHPNIKVVFLPPNTTSIIQPLDQGIIKCFKSYYMKRALSMLIDKVDGNSEMTVSKVWKEFTIRDCINIIGDSVKDLTQSTLNACWRPLWPGIVEKESNVQPIDFNSVVEAANALDNTLNINQYDIEEFVECNDDLSEAEIMQLFEENQRTSYIEEMDIDFGEGGHLIDYEEFESDKVDHLLDLGKAMLLITTKCIICS